MEVVVVEHLGLLEVGVAAHVLGFGLEPDCCGFCQVGEEARNRERPLLAAC